MDTETLVSRVANCQFCCSGRLINGQCCIWDVAYGILDWRNFWQCIFTNTDLTSRTPYNALLKFQDEVPQELYFLLYQT